MEEEKEIQTTKIKQKSKLFEIPFDVLKIILKDFSHEELMNLAVTCQEMHQIISKGYLLTLYGKTCKFLDWHAKQLNELITHIDNYKQSIQISIINPGRMSVKGWITTTISATRSLIGMRAVYLTIKRFMQNEYLILDNSRFWYALACVMLVPIVEDITQTNLNTWLNEFQLLLPQAIDDKAKETLKVILEKFSVILSDNSKIKELLENDLLHPIKTFDMSLQFLDLDIQTLQALQDELIKFTDSVRFTAHKKIPLSNFSEKSQARLRSSLLVWNQLQQEEEKHKLTFVDDIKHLGLHSSVQSGVSH